MTTFHDFGLNRKLLNTIDAQGYETPTPIQAQAIPHLINARDLLGIAQTGTGKTAAFALPTLHNLITTQQKAKAKSPRVLVLAPTRELAQQITDNFRVYARGTGCTIQTVFGGIKIVPQIRGLAKGCHILVATPGRLLDLVEQGAADLGQLEILVLDEADQMLDMGFAVALRKIMAYVPAQRQTMLFSATMPKQIKALAATYLDDPARVSVTPESTTAERVDQSVLHVDADNKPRLLRDLLFHQKAQRTLVFTRTKHGADKLIRILSASDIYAEAIHGNKSQAQRVRALKAFKTGNCTVLIATDIAARGIDIDGISHVINYDMPNVPEQYVHRIGRTARAGRHGKAISLVTPEDLYYLRDVERSIRQEISILAMPSDFEDLLLPEPDRNIRPAKPKVSNGRGSQNKRPKRHKSAARTSQQNPAKRKQQAKPRVRSQEKTIGNTNSKSQAKPRRSAESKPQGKFQGKPQSKRRRRSKKRIAA